MIEVMKKEKHLRLIQETVLHSHLPRPFKFKAIIDKLNAQFAIKVLDRLTNRFHLKHI
jgi:hypothetical protein